MKFKTNFLLTLLAFGLAACSGIRPVPEISPSLMEETVFQFKSDEEPLKILAAHNSELAAIDASGKILRYNPENRMVNDIYHLRVPISRQALHDRDLLVLKEQENDNLIVFNLKAMKTVREMGSLAPDRLVGLQNGVLCYSKGLKLHFHDIETDKPLAVLRRADKEHFLNMSAWRDGRFLVISDQRLYIVSPGGAEPESVPLPHPPSSPMLVDGDDIYYGDSQRNLVRFSLEKRTARWKFRLGDTLRLQPQKAANWVVIIPQDNNICFFTPGGDLYWWDKLNSTRDSAPLILRENVAVALWDRTLKFFNFKKKQTITYPLERKVLSNMAVMGEFVYFISHEELEKNTDTPRFRTIVEVGNNYGADVDTDPPDIIPSGKSVKIRFTVINVPKPHVTARILDEHNAPAYEGAFKNQETVSFVWIPEKAAEYKLELTINGVDKTGVRVEKKLNVINLEQKLLEYYYQIQLNDDADKIADAPEPLR